MSGHFLKSHAEEWQNFQPEIYDCDFLKAEGLRPVFYSGWKNTRVFAWIGLPEGASAEHPVPGIVLVHGGLGTAFSHWVQYWNKLGYAAIAMDNCGGIPLQNHQIGIPASGWPRHKWSGPNGWGALDQWRNPPEDQWFTHAVSSILFANNILRSMPEVNSGRIGITGVSWGAVLTCIAAGIDSRFCAAAPVYGNGFLYECCAMQKNGAFNGFSKEAFEWWKNEWDPANFAPDISMPSFWFASTNDFTFYPMQWTKTGNLITKAPVYRSMQIRWAHGHGPVGEEMPELAAFFADCLQNGNKFIHVGNSKVENGVITAPYANGEPYSATLIVTANAVRDWLPVDAENPSLVRDSKYFVQDWHALSAEIDRKNHTISAKLPDGWKNAYLSALTEDLLESTSSISFSWEGRFLGDSGAE